MDVHVDLRALDVVDPVNDNLVCCICQAPFVDPMVSPCGHTFCGLCIQQSLEGNLNCPIDRSALALSELKPAVKIICNLVNELLVKCPRSEYGCSHVGQRQFIEQHVKNDCQYTVESCRLVECKEMIQRKDKEAHSKTCRFRRIQCDMCKQSLLAFKLEEHRSNCPAETIKCPCCDAMHTRADHDEHQRSCPRRVVPCSHSEFSCEWTGERQELAHHLTTCPYEPIKTYLAQQQRREQAWRDELRNVKLDHEALRREQGELRHQVEEINDQLTLLFPTQFGSEAGPRRDDDTHEAIVAETNQLRNDIDHISANVASLELKQNMALMTETFRLQEEMQSLRALCHGMRMQLHFVMMERRGAMNNSAGTTASSSTRPTISGATTSPTDGSVSAMAPMGRLYPLMQTPAARQDTKL